MNRENLLVGPILARVCSQPIYLAVNRTVTVHEVRYQQSRHKHDEQNRGPKYSPINRQRMHNHFQYSRKPQPKTPSKNPVILFHDATPAAKQYGFYGIIQFRAQGTVH
jgi:hypothetical protein